MVRGKQEDFTLNLFRAAGSEMISGSTILSWLKGVRNPDGSRHFNGDADKYGFFRYLKLIMTNPWQITLEKLQQKDEHGIFSFLINNEYAFLQCIFAQFLQLIKMPMPVSLRHSLPPCSGASAPSPAPCWAASCWALLKYSARPMFPTSCRTPSCLPCSSSSCW